MAKTSASIVLYAVDLGELRSWVGCKDQKRFDEARALISEDDEADWEPDEVRVLEQLLHRLVFEGGLYGELEPERRYYLTQVLIDLFDEFVDQESLTKDIPLDRAVQALETLPRGADDTKLVLGLVRGRELNGTGRIWKDGGIEQAEELLPYFGYVARDEAERAAAAVDRAIQQSRQRPSPILKQLHSALAECARAELDLVSFVG